MKLIIFDYFKRHWLKVILNGLLCLVPGFIMPEISQTPELKEFLFVIVIFLGFMTNTVSSELPAGYARIALLLPLTARQLGRTYWWLSVGFPALSLILLSGMGAIMRIHNISGIYKISGLWLQFSVIGALILGAIFWLFSGAPSMPSKNWKTNLTRQIYSYTFFGVLIGGIYLLQKTAISYGAKLIIVSSFCAGLTILGWLRAEGLLVDYGGYRYEKNDSDEPPPTSKPEINYGGIPFLAAFLGSHLLRITILFILVAGVFSFLFTGGFNWHKLSHALSQYGQFKLYYVGAALIILEPILLHIKLLRTLPMTSRQLAALLLGLLWLLAFVASGVITIATLPDEGMAKSLSMFKVFILSLPPLGVFFVGCLWRGEKRIIPNLIVFIILVISSVPLIYQFFTGIFYSGKQDVAMWLVIGFPLASFILSILALGYLLENNVMTYRIRTNEVSRPTN